MADISSTISGQAGGAIGDDVQGGTTPLPPPPVIPSGEEMYDQIMSQIEPDLVTAQLPLLKEKYKDETPEQAKARADRYNRAFAEYEKQFAAYGSEWEAPEIFYCSFHSFSNSSGLISTMRSIERSVPVFRSSFLCTGTGQRNRPFSMW